MANAYGFCPLPSISFGKRSYSCQIVSQSRRQHLQHNQLSLHPQLTDDTNKSSIWVNPKSSKSSTFTQKTDRSSYTSLTKLAESLNTYSPVEKDIFDLLDRNVGNKPVDQDGVTILNNMSNSQTARIVLKYFLDKCNSNRKLVLYNVTLKVFRKCKDLDSAEQLFDEMLQRSITPDIVTFSTIIACARMSFLPGKAVSWFERMPEFGIQPDNATLSVMIDAYGRVGNVDTALNLYNRARTEKWRVGAVTFTTVIRINGKIGNFNECVTVFREMKDHGIKPDLGCYNTLLDAITRAKLPSEIKSIHQEIMSSELKLKPGWATYAALLRAYCKSNCGDEAMNVYKEMKKKGMVLNNVLYNTILSMCVDLGFVSEADEVFDNMKRFKDCRPDSRTFSLLITIFSKYGKVEKAEAAFKEMLDAGFDHDIYVLTNLIECYAKLDMRDDVARMVDTIMELDLSCDERACGCLLKVMTRVDRGEFGRVMGCIEKVDPKLGNLVKRVVGFDEIGENEVSEGLAHVGNDVRKVYCDCFIDLCIKLEKLEKASFFRTLL